MKYILLILLSVFVANTKAQVLRLHGSIGSLASYTKYSPRSLSVDSEVYCRSLYKEGQYLIDEMTSTGWHKANDTLRLFIESCALSNTAADGSPAFHAFQDICGAVQGMDTVNVRWLNLREWLKKVLYLNPDTGYYCFDVQKFLQHLITMCPAKASM
jgi:hypothetical protein